MSKNVSRRTFLTGASLAGGTAALAGLAGCAQSTTGEGADDALAVTGSDIAWDRETEVLIVGFGGAGSVAAVTAHEEGAEVLILEKAPIEGGGCSRMSGGFCTIVNDVDAAATYLKTISKGLTSDEVIEAWCEEATNTKDWLDDHGILYAEQKGQGADFPNVPGAEGLGCVDICDEREMMNTGGGVFFEWATNYMNENGIEILFDTPATRIIKDATTGEVLGVKATSAGAEMNIRAKKAVLLACGGFAANDEMLGTYIRPYPVGTEGWPYDDGDGIRLLQGAGASLSHMSLPCAVGYTFAIPGQISNRWNPNFAAGGSYFFINRTGKRFVCENPNNYFGHRSFMEFDAWDQSCEQTTSDYRDIPLYIIFDEAERVAGPFYQNGLNIGVTVLPKELGGIEEDWSEDNSKEVEAGWILKADTIEELCEKINENSKDEGFDIDPATLKETLDTFNSYCAAGEDPEFGRPATVASRGGDEAPNLVALQGGPYYAMRLIPALYSTCGGGTKNAKGQILDPWGEPIPRLYGAGVVAHSAAQAYSTFGQNWGEIMNFGRISGRNAAAEESLA